MLCPLFFRVWRFINNTRHCATVTTLDKTEYILATFLSPPYIGIGVIRIASWSVTASTRVRSQHYGATSRRLNNGSATHRALMELSRTLLPFNLCYYYIKCVKTRNHNSLIKISRRHVEFRNCSLFHQRTFRDRSVRRQPELTFPKSVAGKAVFKLSIDYGEKLTTLRRKVVSSILWNI